MPSSYHGAPEKSQALTLGSLERSKGVTMPYAAGKKFPYTAAGKKKAAAAKKKAAKKPMKRGGRK